jgi:hypothetical protein
MLHGLLVFGDNCWFVGITKYIIVIDTGYGRALWKPYERHHIFVAPFWYTYLLMWHYNQYLVKACPRRSFHNCLSWAQCVQSLTPRARLSLFTPSAHLDFGLPCLFVVGLRVFWSCDQRSAICLFSWHLGHRSDIRRLKATNISFPISESISESISPSFLEMKMNTPSLVSKFALFLLSSKNTYLLPHFLWENKKTHTHRRRKHRKIMHVEASTQITHPLPKFVNVKQESRIYLQIK